MKAVVQRVGETSLCVEGKLVSRIAGGLCVYLGIAQGDTSAQADKLAYKVAKLRIFEDDAQKMNLSVTDVGGEILVVSQFTLCGDCSHGHRPSFSNAEEPIKAKALYEHFCAKLSEYGITVKTGVFGADMKISQFNDGPVTIILEL